MQRLALFSPLIVMGVLFGGAFFVYALTNSETPTAIITVPEGAAVGDINKILREKGVLTEDLPQNLEGYLFPDTYEFFTPSNTETVKAKFQENFNRRVRNIIPGETDEAGLKEILIKASLLEKEVPDSSERRVAAGIMMKRLENGIPLQMDASFCYTKKSPCLPITEEDKLSDSPYNTYIYSGLPPQPIANPGLDAISAAINPAGSPYWFYISDPKTKTTIFSKTLDEHNNNIVKYLNTN